MEFMVKFPEQDDVSLEIKNSKDEVNEIVIVIHDKCLNQTLSYYTDAENIRLAIRKLTAK